MGEGRPPTTEPASREPAGRMGAVTSGEPDAAPAPDEIEQRKRHRRRVLAWACGALALVLLIAGVGVYLAYRHLSHNVHTSNISGLTGPRIHDPVPGDQNIVVVGSDNRAGTGGQYGNPQAYTTAHSDTLMIIHLAANRKWAEVVSVPRDSWVSIPACKMGNGQMSSPQNFKINEAFALGSLNGSQANGVACTIKTLQQNTGVSMDHFVSISFNGFKDMVNALGGVQVCNNQAINDPEAHLDLPAGHHTLNGRQALGYVRARYTLGTGSDLERIGRQQAFMSSLASRAQSELYNPIAIYQFLDAATSSVTIDSGMGGINGLYALATELKKLPANKLTFITMPTFPRSQIDPSDTANVMWKQPEASEIFASMRDDVPFSRQPRPRSGRGSSAATPTPGPSQPGAQQPAPSQQSGAQQPTPGQSTGGSPSPAPSPNVTTRTGNQNICM